MTIGDILVNTNRANLNNLLPLSEVKTKKDFAKFKKKGYTVGMTAGEFQEKYPLLPIENIYASYNSCPRSIIASLKILPSRLS